MIETTRLRINTNEQTPIAHRLEGVDLLRGISILAVILLHANIRMRLAGFSFRSHFPPWLYHLLFTNGNNGVTVFFAISGFLITLTSLRRFGSLGDVQPAVFYRLRFARIAPLLLLILFVLSLLHLANAEGFVIPSSRATLPEAILSALTFTLNRLEAVRGYLPANWDVLWSLSVEETFYLFFPLACLLLRHPKGIRVFIALLVALIAAGPFARTIWTNNDIWREKSYFGGMDGIAFGCLTALLVNILLKSGISKQAKYQLPLRVLSVSGFVLLFLIALWPAWPVTRFIGRSGLDGTLLALGTCFVAISSALSTSAPLRFTAPLRWLGRNSYEVYMTHEFIVVWAVMAYVKRPLGPQSLWILAIVLLSGLLGAVVARVYSEPLNRKLRHRLSRPFA